MIAGADLITFSKVIPLLSILGSPAGCSEPLYSSDRQGFVIMMDKIPDRSDMIFNFF